MAAESRSVVVRLSLETAQAIAASKQFGDEMDRAMSRAEKSSAKASAALDHVGGVAGKVAFATAAALGAMGKAAVDWESDWAGVTKTVDGSASELAALEDGLRGLAKTLPATHTEIAGVAEAAGQLGVAREDVVDFTETMVALGETTNLTAEDAATSIAQISNVMGTAAGDVDNLGASLVALGNDGASTEAEILGMAQRIAGAGAQIGLAESDILAIANAAASMGINVEAGGSAISRVFTELAKATSSGGPKLEQFASTAGMTGDAFVKAFQDDPAAAFAAFTTGLDEVNKSGGDVFTLLDQLGMSDVRVSQALLGMAASGDLLTESLALGAEAWEENTALADEAAKRYDTTGSQIQVAWNQIKDAGIEAGEVLLPVLGKTASAVGTLASAFGQLPDPVQGAATGLLAVTTLLGGGVWAGAKVINGVTGIRDSLSTLRGAGADGAQGLGRASSAITNLGKVAAGAGAVVALLAIGDAIDRLGDDDLTVGVEAVTGQLLRMAEGDTGALAGDFDNLGDSIARLGENKGGLLELNDSLAGVFGFGFGQDFREATAEIGLLDQALSGIVSSDGIPAAESAFQALAEAQGLTVAEQRELANLMPQWRDSIAGAQNDTRGAADATAALGGATEDVGAAMGAAAPLTEEQAEALQKVRDAGREAAGSFVGLGDSLDDAEVSLGGWLSEMEANNQALANFRDNARQAGKRGLDDGLVASLHQAGEVGARRMAQLANATESEIDRANGAWRRQQREIAKTEDQAVRLAGMSPVKLDVNADTDQATSALKAVKAYLDGLKSKSITLTTIYNRVNAHHAPGATPSRAGPQEFTQANGGVMDFYANGGMREDHVAQIAPAGSWRVWAEPETGGEAYIPLSPAKRDRSIDIWEQVGQRLGVQFARFADGGITGRPTIEQRIDVARLEQTIRQLMRDLQQDGKDRLKGKGREIAQLELQAAKANLAAAKEAPGKEAAEAAVEAATEKSEAAWDTTRRALEAQEAGIEAAVESLGGQLKSQEEALAVATKAFQDVAAKMEQTGQASVAGFQTGLFERDSNAWASGAGGGPFANLARDIAGLQERGALQQQLSAAGLTGDALAAVLAQGGNADLSALVTSGRAAELQGLFNTRAALSGQVATEAGRAAYGAEYDARMVEAFRKAGQVDALAARIDQTNVQLEEIRQAVQVGAVDTGVVVSTAVVTGGNKVARRRRRDV